MEDKLYNQLIDSMVEELSNSKLDLKEFIMNALETERELNKFKKGVKDIASYSHSVAVSIILDDLLGREF